MNGRSLGDVGATTHSGGSLPQMVEQQESDSKRIVHRDLRIILGGLRHANVVPKDAKNAYSENAQPSRHQTLDLIN